MNGYTLTLAAFLLRVSPLLRLAPSGSSYVVYVRPAVVVFGLAVTVAPLTATASRACTAASMRLH